MFRKSFLLFALLVIGGKSYAQTSTSGQTNADRAISTSVPFLMIGPDARSAAMGDVGVATSSDANAIHWNPSKLAFTEKELSATISYSPWLRKLVPDMSISYLAGYKRLNRRSVIGASVRYFDLGELQFTNDNGQPIQDFNPREIALDATYAMQLSKTFAMGVTARYINSNLAGNVSNSSVQVNASPGNSLAADISLYGKKEITLSGLPSELAYGMNLSNIGQKMTYNDADDADFIPTNMRLGAALTTELDEFNKFTFALDFNKLLVPSPPIKDVNGEVIKGRDTEDLNLVSGIFGSFSDAPNGFSEEVQEVSVSAGVEYWYNNIFAIRGGYFYEHADKGNRKYFTLGIGLRYNTFGIDFAYLVPQTQEHPLADTMRFSLLFDFAKPSKATESDVSDTENS